MYGRTYDEIYAFWSSFQKAWITLYGNPDHCGRNYGNSPAGGCLLALSCDHRVMAEGKYGIGLNETKVGIVAPIWMKNTMQNVIGFRETDRALQEGKLFTPPQAKEIGLVDVVAPMDQIIPSCRDFIKDYLKLPFVIILAGFFAFRRTKVSDQTDDAQDTINQLQSKLHQDADFTANFLTQDVFQNALEKYVQALAKKSK
ncbi:putative enoyl-CoA delta isomerase 1, mitochondrial isoform X1 [Apostichopus japonicus]|uniref:Putative enoyl-CoA delta isomerase 1, mitochondrial isoform X1 n=1 Tax=Stichopus japonicus TaxID=307972 RepID=A0A2G8L9Z4_STIJA|nr:putative enoyl-CoA delta isomerase 1, mitochondrial isoform X1 [Apostichopus japonicus]